MSNINFNPFPVLCTKRLTLRGLKMTDDQAVLDYQSDKNNFKYVDMPIYHTIDDARKYIAKMNTGVTSNKWIIWAIADKQTDKAIGTISLWNISQDQTKAELGYGLYPGYRGKGYMSEALQKALEYGFKVMKLEVIESYTNVQNKKSIELLVRNKFTKVSNFTETHTYSGEPMEMFIYAIKPELHGSYNV